jgi:NAD(P)-dependent dehydrogenase (short-subunit alcohol dehydrogenase family)
MSKIALVTGANRGIGLETVRQLAGAGIRTFLGSRDLAKGRRAWEELPAPLREKVRVLELDVARPKSVEAAARALATESNHLNILINNAGINYDTWQRGISADIEGVSKETFETNFFGAWRVTKAFLPLLRASGSARVVNVSSGAGSLASMTGGTPAYSTSKAALNALTIILAQELRAEKILVNAVCPAGSQPTWAAPGAGPSSWAHAVLSGQPQFQMKGPPVASFGTAIP